MEKLTNIPWAAQDELYAELSKVSQVAALSPKERAAYDENLRQYRDNLAALAASYEDGIKEGEKVGREQGEKIGREQRNLEIASKLIDLQFEDSIIVQSTGLSLNEIQKLRAGK